MVRFTIANARLYGTGSELARGWLTVEGERIAALGAGDPPRGAPSMMDAAGLALSPGFIDLHGHTDALVLVNPGLESKLLQGVTLEVGGNCGSSAWPATPGVAEEVRPWEQAFGVDLHIQEPEALATRAAQVGLSTNYALLAGHGNLRAAVLGYADRPSTPAEQAQMGALLGRFLAAGAWGLSFGLAYPPGMFADRQELAAVAGVVQGRGFLAFHLRSESDRLLEAVGEAIAVGREARVPVHLSHHKALGPANWGKVAESLALVDAARAAGQEVTADVYPYTATCTGLYSVLPNWAQEGGVEGMLARLRDEPARRRMASDLAHRLSDRTWLSSIVIARAFDPASRRWEGRNMAEVAAETGRPPAEALFTLLLADGARTEMVRLGSMSEQDMIAVLRHPAVCVASDATARTFAGPLAEGKPHPRAFGTFPRVLGRYVREQGVLTLSQALAKMTSQPASRLGLADRGALQPGYYADLVLFDPATVADRATFTDPVQPPVGIEAVWVNGTQVVDRGRLTGARPGRWLAR